MLELLAAHNVIAEYVAIDMSLHPEDIVDEFKLRQATAITANLRHEHSEAVVQGMHEDAEGIRRMSNPLFVQAFLSIDLTLEMVDVAVNYYAQRRPEELAEFVWTIDRKDRTVTQMEQLWSHANALGRRVTKLFAPSCLGGRFRLHTFRKICS